MRPALQLRQPKPGQEDLSRYSHHPSPRPSLSQIGGKPYRIVTGSHRSLAARRSRGMVAYARQHFLYFFPLPHGQGSFRPTLTGREDTSVSRLSSDGPN
jgi:hypothetical protein